MFFNFRTVSIRLPIKVRGLVSRGETCPICWDRVPFFLHIIRPVSRESLYGLCTSTRSYICLILSAAVSLIGCEEVPTVQPGAPIVQPATNPSTPPVVQTITPKAPVQHQPSAELEDPRAVIGKFLNTPTTERKDTDVLRVCNLSSGTDEFKNLDLNSSSVTDEGLKQLAKLNHLETLNLTSTKITAVGFAVTLELPQLRSVTLTNCNVTLMKRFLRVRMMI